MALAASQRFQRFGAVGLLVIVLWVVTRLVLAYMSERLRLSNDEADIEQEYRQLLDRRVDISALELQLSRLNESDAVRQLTIEATTDRAALVRLQQISRTAAEAAQGKLLSSVEVSTNSITGTVALLIRARVPEGGITQFLGSLENGNPRITLDDLTLASRPIKTGETGDIEITSTLRVRWLAPGKAT